MTGRIAMAVAAHPDDIEMMMAGTLILLGQAGYELHYMNIGSGSGGSVVMNAAETAAVRTEEARRAAAFIGAIHHEPLIDDLEIFYDQSLIRKLCYIVRQVRPEILLLPSPLDYMEDHITSSRLMVTAAFCRNIPNYDTDPPSGPADVQMALYHALPYGLADQLRNPVIPHFYVDITSTLEKKREMLAFHKSQKDWLDKTQGVDNYLNTMIEMSVEAGKMSGKYKYAEGWQRHSHLGFGNKEFDPLKDAIGDYITSRS